MYYYGHQKLKGTLNEGDLKRKFLEGTYNFQHKHFFKDNSNNGDKGKTNYDPIGDETYDTKGEMGTRTHLYYQCTASA